MALGEMDATASHSKTPVTKLGPGPRYDTSVHQLIADVDRLSGIHTCFLEAPRRAPDHVAPTAAAVYACDWMYSRVATVNPA